MTGAEGTAPPPSLESARRELLLDCVGIAVSVGGFGLVYGLAARNAGLSPVEAVAMSVMPFAGASQFAAVGYVSQHLPWLTIVVLTAVVNARHLLYSASLAPRLRRVPLLQRVAMSQFLTDEAFALSAGHFRRLGRVDVPGYWIAAILAVFVPWNVATLIGVLVGGAVPDPTRFGLDAIFPAAMGGLAVGLMTGRREIVAAGAGAAMGVLLSVLAGTGPGIVAGGLLGPVAGMVAPDRGRRALPDSDVAGIPVDLDEAASEMEGLSAAGEPAAGGPAAGEPAAGGPAAGGPAAGGGPR